MKLETENQENQLETYLFVWHKYGMVNLLLDPASKQCTNMAMVNKAKRSEKRACINRVILFKMLFKVARTWDQQHDIHLSFSKKFEKNW